MTALHALSAADLSAAFARRSLSPVEVTQAVIAQIGRCEPQVQALYAYDPDAALARHGPVKRAGPRAGRCQRWTACPAR